MRLGEEVEETAALVCVQGHRLTQAAHKHGWCSLQCYHSELLKYKAQAGEYVQGSAANPSPAHQSDLAKSKMASILMMQNQNALGPNHFQNAFKIRQLLLTTLAI